MGTLTHRTQVRMRFLPVRSGRILVELPDLESALALRASLDRDPIEGVHELIPAARTVLVAFDPAEKSPSCLAEEISRRDLSTTPVTAGELVEIPVQYDGEDLAEVASMLGISQTEVVRRHTSARYTVAFTGFAPGFAYLAGGDPRLNVPRRKTPRTQVPAGAVGLAGEFSGVYPKTSPGGWQLIGSTPLAMFNLARDPAALLQPGYSVRFIDVSNLSLATSVTPLAGKPTQPSFVQVHSAHIDILDAPFPILFQDLGRSGQASQGISVSGAADKAGLKTANRLVGNLPDAPALEVALGQLRFRVRGRAVMAQAGAWASVHIEAVDGSAFTAMHGEATALEDGDIVSIGAPKRGFRSYIAVRGGFDVGTVLGSVACDTLAQIGPRPLTAGDSAAVLQAHPGAVVSLSEAPHRDLPAEGDVVTLDVSLGPRTDWFTPEAVELFLSEDWEVTPQSSCIGIRLRGTALERCDLRELQSEATVQGAVQVPASGQPVLFLSDHPLTGGYPVIANLAPYHLDLAGQIPIGARIRFRALDGFAEIKPAGDRT